MVENLFATPIWVSEFSSDISEFNSIQDEIKNIIPKYKDGLKYTWGDRVLTSMYQTAHFLDDTPLLKAYIISHIKAFPIFKNDILFKQSWINYTKPGGYQNFHNHLPDAQLSGVYYYETNGNDGDILFRTDSGGIHHSGRMLNVRNIVNYKPKIGKIIIFPAHLDHSVEENKTNFDRISIAFNCELNFK